MEDNKNSPINIYDIAQMAKVSIATVSRVVNGSDKVSPATRRKVEKIIAEVGYTPNAFAKGLGLNTMHTVGIMVPSMADDFMAKAVNDLEQELGKYGYDCLLNCSGFLKENKKKQLEVLLSKHVDALILVGSTYAGRGESADETEYIREAAQKVPVFVINGNVKGDNVYVTVCDDHSAVKDVTLRLLKSGKKNILFLTDSRSYSANKKRSGYEEAFAEAGMPLREAMEVFVKNDIREVREYLKRVRPEFDAAVATEDVIAIGVMKYANDIGLKVPEDLPVVGYNNSRMALACEPELSSIDNGLREMCLSTVKRLMNLLEENGSGKAEKKVVIPCALVERGSTAFEE